MRALGLSALALTLLGAPASSQTRLAWPDTTVDFARYTTVEECQAAASRVADGAVSHEAMISRIWRDTMPPNSLERLAPLPGVVGETLRRCLTRFAAVNAVPLKYFRTLLPLYLIAGWDEKAQALAARRLAAVASTAQPEVVAVIDSVATIYTYVGGLNVRPPRLDLAEAFVSTHSPRVSDRTMRLQIYLKLLMRAAPEWRTDTVGVHRILRRAVAIADSLTDRERASLKNAKLLGVDLAIEKVGNLEEQLYAVIISGEVASRTSLDSLRRSTTAFVALRRENWRRVTRRPAAAFATPIGQPAPAIQGDIWLGRSSTSGPRPTPGRVSVVSFFNRAVDGSDAKNVVSLRRLAERFPELEITVVTQSHGYFMALKDSVTPAREAELTKRWLESLGLKGALAMTSTDFWRLSAYDRRRVDRTVANRTNYSFGGKWSTGFEGATYLIDAEGMLVHASVVPISRDDEQEFADLIEVLLTREKP